MDYYKLAEEPLASAHDLIGCGRFRMSVSMSTLAIDMYLKSVLYRLDSVNTLLTGHDHIGILRLIEKRYPKPELRPLVKLSRKYFNDAQYSDTENLVVYDEQLAMDFISHALQIKAYVDNDCQASLEDLKQRFDLMR